MAAVGHWRSCSRSRKEPRAAAGSRLLRPRFYTQGVSRRMWRLPSRPPSAQLRLLDVTHSWTPPPAPPPGGEGEGTSRPRPPWGRDACGRRGSREARTEVGASLDTRAMAGGRSPEGRPRACPCLPTPTSPAQTHRRHHSPPPTEGSRPRWTLKEFGTDLAVPCVGRRCSHSRKKSLQSL